MNIINLLKSFRTNAVIIGMVALVIERVGVNISVDKIGSDLDSLILAVSSVVGVIGIVRQYVRGSKSATSNPLPEEK